MTDRPARRHPDLASRAAARDRGAILPLILVLIVVGALWTLPVLAYSSTILNANEALSNKTQRIEAVKSGLRVALADPVALYHACGARGLTIPGSTGDGLTYTTRCSGVASATSFGDGELRIGVTATSAGAAVPEALTGTRWTPTTSALDDWYGDASAESETDRVWLPLLPVRAPDLRAAGGHAMPAGARECTVYFPGTYPDPLVLDGPTFFTSGTYYFEAEVAVIGGADVVVGDGATSGCATDQEAAFLASNAPATHNIGGLGATWIFGGAGRLSVTGGEVDPIRFVMNRRYVAPDDLGALPSADISIMTVNGARVDAAATDLLVPDFLDVPLSAVGGEREADADEQGYVPSIHVPRPLAPTADEPEGDPAEPPTEPVPAIVEINLIGAAPATVDIPGYLAVPQGRFHVSNPAGHPVAVTGGVLAAVLDVDDGRANGPGSIEIGLITQIVQRTLRIVTTTPEGPETSSAVVQVNQNGAFAINTWVVQ